MKYRINSRLIRTQLSSGREVAERRYLPLRRVWFFWWPTLNSRWFISENEARWNIDRDAELRLRSKPEYEDIEVSIK